MGASEVVLPTISQERWAIGELRLGSCRIVDFASGLGKSAAKSLTGHETEQLFVVCVGDERREQNEARQVNGPRRELGHDHRVPLHEPRPQVEATALDLRQHADDLRAKLTLAGAE